MVIVISSEKNQANLLDVSKDEYIALLLTLTDRVNALTSIVETNDEELKKTIKFPEGYNIQEFRDGAEKQLSLNKPIFDLLKAKRKEIESE